MQDRIRILSEKVIKGELFIESTPTSYDRKDIFLSPVIMDAKRASEYILNQKPYVSEYTALTGYLRFSGDVKGDIFNRNGHENFRKMMTDYYCKPVDGLCTFEWQHSVADFEKVIKIGINGLKAEIEQSKKNHTEKDKLEFLEALDIIADAIIGWAEKCSVAALEESSKTEDEDYQNNLINLSKALKNVPANPASCFYEAVLSLYIIYAFVPDSIGCIDRYLYPFYIKDISDGSLSEEDAKAYLQELFLMLQSRISVKSDRFYRGGESHFCVGGYTEDGEDGFNELTKLILESMLELPTWIPQVSLRWTKKTPKDVLKYVMELERKDPNKRIAFVNDEPRIKMLTEYAGFLYSVACRYTMVGCNEPQLPGGIFMGGIDTNFPKSIESTLYTRKTELSAANTFEDVYRIYEEELYKTLDKAVYYYNCFQKVRARDINVVSSMFFEGSIQRAKSITQGGAKNAVASIGLIGLTTVIDSLTVIRQLVFEEKNITMAELLDALESNWDGYDELRIKILHNTKFFGNNEEISDNTALKITNSLYNYFKDKESDLGYKYVLGNLIGYNQHNKWFGDCLKATPDGRYAGDTISFGIGQTEGKDREGITALLSSVAKFNDSPVVCGASVTNVLLEKQLIDNDESFDLLVDLFETYFKIGGLHFQLTYVSKDDLKNAQHTPDKYRNLRVRVSGFSDYFVFLNKDLQDEIIVRTEKKK